MSVLSSARQEGRSGDLVAECDDISCNEMNIINGVLWYHLRCDVKDSHSAVKIIKQETE